MPRRLVAPSPEQAALFSGRFRMGPEYFTVRPGGSGNWLLFATNGGAGVLTLPQGQVRATPGSLILLPMGTPHDYRTDPHADQRKVSWIFTWVHVKPPPDWLPLLDWPEPVPGIRRLNPPPAMFSRILALLDQADAQLGHLGRHSRTLAWLRLHEALLLADEAKPRGAPDLGERLRLVLEHIELNPTTPHSIDSLAAVAGLSATRFAHVFRSAVGLPPLRYVLDRRLHRAGRRLLDGDIPVATVAAEVGFSNAFHFSTRFRRWSGYSPTAWRQRWCFPATAEVPATPVTRPR